MNPEDLFRDLFEQQHKARQAAQGELYSESTTYKGIVFPMLVRTLDNQLVKVVNDTQLIRFRSQLQNNQKALSDFDGCLSQLMAL